MLLFQFAKLGKKYHSAIHKKPCRCRFLRFGNILLICPPEVYILHSFADSSATPPLFFPMKWGKIEAKYLF